MTKYVLIGKVDANCEECGSGETCNNYKDEYDNYYLFCRACTKRLGYETGIRGKGNKRFAKGS